MRTWQGVIRPLTPGPRAPKRSVWRARAAITWPRRSAEVGPGGASASWVKGTAGTSTWRSMRSSRGPEDLADTSRPGGLQPQASRIRPITAGTWVHGGDKDEFGGKRRATQGAADRDMAFFEGLAKNFEGLAVELRQFIRNETPLCARRDLTGWGVLPPPTGVADGVVGRAEGRTARGGAGRRGQSHRGCRCGWSRGFRWGVGGGMIVGSRLARRVLPVPGGPTSRTLCEPAAAISIARLA